MLPIWLKSSGLDSDKTSITEAEWPAFDEAHLVESNFSYPVSFNGKMRFKIDLPLDFNPKQVEEAVLAHEKSDGYLGGNPPKKSLLFQVELSTS